METDPSDARIDDPTEEDLQDPEDLVDDGGEALDDLDDLDDEPAAGTDEAPIGP